MYIFTNKQAFIFVLFVFRLLKHSDEPSTLLGGGTELLLKGEGARPLCPPLVTALVSGVARRGGRTSKTLSPTRNSEKFAKDWKQAEGSASSKSRYQLKS